MRFPLSTAITAIAAVAVCLPSLAVAGGKVLTTAAHPGSLAGADNFVCIAINKGAKDAEVTVEIIDAVGGTVLTTVGPVLTASMRRMAATVNSPGASPYCRVTGLTSKTGAVSFFTMDGSVVLATTTAP